MPTAAPVQVPKLLEVVKTLPAAPRVFAQVSKLLLNANSDSAEVIRLLRLDTALTAHLIKISNSVVYQPEQPTSTVEEAVLRIGYKEIYRVTGLAAAAELTSQNLPTYGITGAQLRENAVLCALVAEALAPFAGCDQQHAYTAALLRSVGRVALDRVARRTGERDAIPEIEPKRIAEWETATFGLSNPDAAAYILNHWRFSPHIFSAIRDHYLLAPTESKLAYLLNVAAGAADRCQHGLPGESGYWHPVEERCETLGVSEEQVDEATRQALINFGPVRASID